MKAMILAAGEGTRLLPLTSTQPKPMLPVGRRPTLEWILAWLHYYGIREAMLNLSHLPERVIDYFGDGSEFAMRLHYSVEETLLGTAGGIKRVESFFQETFLIVYGDVLTDMDLLSFMAFHHRHAAAPHLSLSLYHAPNPQECGIVSVNDEQRVTRFVEKPSHKSLFSNLANAGILLMEPSLLAAIPEHGFFDLSHDLLPRLLQQNVPIYGHLLPETTYLIDMGTPDKYERAQREWPTDQSRRFLLKEENP